MKPRFRTTSPQHRFRRQHNAIERVADQITDADGNIGNPHRAIGLLTTMERAGRITPGMRIAGDRFHELFILAHFEPLHAADMGRVGGCGGAPAFSGSQKAKDAIHGALRALGDRSHLSSPAGCCAWFVLGCELSLTQWARREGWGGRPISAHVASGILIGALGVLQKHFGF